MMRNPIEYVVGDLEAKKQWREYKTRVKALPNEYQQTYKGLERYAMIFGPVDHSDSMLRMLDDLIDLLERAAADEQPIRDVVGEDPTDFIEAFIDAYRGNGKSFVEKERAKLAGAVTDAVAEQERKSGGGSR
jgi:DNA-binding ferritin-like protein (Dps family)